MLSMTPMMSAIFFELVWMSLMVLTTRRTISPPFAATSFDCRASALAWVALSALFFTVSLSSTMLDAVSSRLLACSSVRPERS